MMADQLHVLAREPSAGCKEKPIVIAIDDLQWGDSDTAALLLDVLRPPNPPPIMVILCQRDTDGADRSGCTPRLISALKDASRRALAISSVHPKPCSRASNLEV